MFWRSLIGVLALFCAAPSFAACPNPPPAITVTGTPYFDPSSQYWCFLNISGINTSFPGGGGVSITSSSLTLSPSPLTGTGTIDCPVSSSILKGCSEVDGTTLLASLGVHSLNLGASNTWTGTERFATQLQGDNSTKAATTAYADRSFTSTQPGAAPASGGGTTNFLRADGTWAAPPGGSNPFSPPLVTNFTCNTVSGASITDTTTPTAALVMLEPAQSGDNAFRCFDNASYPTTPFTLLACANFTLPQYDFYGASVIIGDGSGKFVSISFLNNIGTGQASEIGVFHWASATSTTAVVQKYVTPMIRCLSITDNGTTLAYAAGADVNGQITLTSESRTTFLSSPSQVGLAVNANDNSSSGLSETANWYNYAK